MMRLNGISKIFDSQTVLDRVDLEIAAGETHGIVGSNGAGKTVLAGIMTGAYAPDSGTIEIEGKPVVLSSPRGAMRYGIVAIQQETNIAENLSVAENVFIDRMADLPGRAPLVRWSRLYEEARDVLAGLGLEADPRRNASTLNPGERQIVKIARALSARPRLLVMDEPFINLPPADSERFLAIARKLKADGVTFVYISHDLDDILRECGTVTVLNEGKAITAVSPESENRERTLRDLLGISRQFGYPRIPLDVKRVVLKASGLRTSRGLEGVSFALRKGEILGVTGKLGAGKSSVARALFGIDRLSGGTVVLDGRSFRAKSPRDALRAGIGYLPEDRLHEWLLADRPIPENVTLINPGEVHRKCLLRKRDERYVVGRYMKSLKIKAPRTDAIIAHLSGGTQQKVAIAKLLFSNSRILMLDEPTKELDSSTKVEVYNLMTKSAAEGMSILFISSDERELLGMCDRILVMDGGRVSRFLARRKDAGGTGAEETCWETIDAAASGESA